MRVSHKFLIILCLSGTALSQPVQAQDVPPAVAAMLESLERQTTIKPTYESLATDANGDVTIRNLTLSQPGEGDDPSVTLRIDETVLSNLSDRGDGLYEIGNATFTNMNGDVSGPDLAVTFSIPESLAEGWYIRTLGDAPSDQDVVMANMNLVRKMQAGKMTWASMGQTFEVDGYQQSWDGDPRTGSGNYDMKVSHIAIPGSVLAMVDQGGVLKQLGYDGLKLDIAARSDVTINDGLYALSFDVGITSREMGTITLAASGADLPIAAFAALQKAQAAGQQPDMNALMPQLQGVTLKSASFRFDDLSITKKVLPMLAAMQGMDEATLIGSAGPMLQMGLMQLQNPAFAEKTAAAINGFLKDPKSITIAATPSAPVKVSEFMTMNPNAPGEIIDRLGVSVTSND